MISSSPQYKPATRSIRRKLFLLRIGIGAVMGLAIGISAVSIAGWVLYTSALKDLSASVSMTRHQIATVVQSMSGLVESIAGSEEIEKYFHSGRDVVLYRLFQSHSDPFAHLTYLGNSGRPEVTFINGRLTETEQPPDTSQEFLSAHSTPGQVFIRGPVWDAALGRFVLTFYYRHQDYFENPYGILKACMPLDKVALNFDAIFQREDRYQIFVTDAQNRIVYGPRKTDLGKTSSTVFKAPDALGDRLEPDRIERQTIYGQNSFIVMNLVPTTDWKVFLAQPTGSIYRPLFMVTGLTAVAVFIYLVLGEVISKKIGFRLIEPVSRLTQVMTEILEKGDLEQRVQWGSRDEMGELAAAFNSMMDKIHTTQTEIQRQKTEQLELEISKRREEQERLRKAMIELEAATRTKGEFLANMSHEIRTPMNGIMGMAELVMDTPLDTNQKELVSTISSEADALMDILNDILDFSKIEAGKLELIQVPFNLRQLFEEISATYAVSACKKGLELFSYMPPGLPEQLLGDPGRLRQILVNLTGNALKFTHKGYVFLWIDKVTAVDQGLEVTFCIKDTGIGIPSDRQDAIFDSFSQADGSTTRQYGGTGLGTTISKQLAEMMGGEIWLESSPGQGSAFWFSVVMKEDPEAGEASPVERPEKGARVLLATPQEPTAMVLTSYLDALGCETIHVDNCKKAFEVIGESRGDRRIDLVLADEEISPINGPELRQALDMSKRIGTLPVVLLVAMTSAGRKEFRSAGGLPNVLAKPVRFNQLEKMISALLSDPGEQEPTPALPSQGRDRDRGSGIRILLVEDYPTNQKVAQRHLENAGYTVVLAENGEQAVDLFRQEIFHAILMDIQMPVMDGYEATRQIRRIEAENDTEDDGIPIIAMTAHAIKGYREKCLAAKMNDYVAKPLKRYELIDAVEKWTFSTSRQAGRGPGRQERRNESMPLDLSAVLHEFDGDKPFFKKVLDEFLSALARQVEEMKEALRTGDYGKIAAHAHSIHGGSANLAALDLSAAAAQLEEDAGKENQKASGRGLATLEREIHRLREFAKDL